MESADVISSDIWRSNLQEILSDAELLTVEDCLAEAYAIHIRDVTKTSAMLKYAPYPIEFMCPITLPKRRICRRETMNPTNFIQPRKQELLKDVSSTQVATVQSYALIGLKTLLSDNDLRNINEMILTYNESLNQKLLTVKVPSCTPLTLSQVHDWNLWWPCVAKRAPLQTTPPPSVNVFSDATIISMKYLVKLAFQEAKCCSGKNKVGCVIADRNGKVIGFAHDNTEKNVLGHAVLNCINQAADAIGQSKGKRKLYQIEPEVEQNTSQNSCSHDSQTVLSESQYLCSGFTAFITHEPCTMCSMALLHSRIDQVIYVQPSPGAGALGSLHKLHCQPKGLNHTFQVYSLQYENSI